VLLCKVSMGLHIDFFLYNTPSKHITYVWIMDKYNRRDTPTTITCLVTCSLLGNIWLSRKEWYVWHQSI
jgi:hypothetical protein